MDFNLLQEVAQRAAATVAPLQPNSFTPQEWEVIMSIQSNPTHSAFFESLLSKYQELSKSAVTAWTLVTEMREKIEKMNTEVIGLWHAFKKLKVQQQKTILMMPSDATFIDLLNQINATKGALSDENMSGQDQSSQLPPLLPPVNQSLMVNISPATSVGLMIDSNIPTTPTKSTPISTWRNEKRKTPLITQPRDTPRRVLSSKKKKNGRVGPFKGLFLGSDNLPVPDGFFPARELKKGLKDKNGQKVEVVHCPNCDLMVQMSGKNGYANLQKHLKGFCPFNKEEKEGGALPTKARNKVTKVNELKKPWSKGGNVSSPAMTTATPILTFSSDDKENSEHQKNTFSEQAEAAVTGSQVSSLLNLVAVSNDVQSINGQPVVSRHPQEICDEGDDETVKTSEQTSSGDDVADY